MLTMLGSLVGGLGLFMLGMSLMSDGLKQLAGNKLNHVLQNWTSTKLRGITTGFLLTTIIQHSGAVTLATIGFANAGILNLRRAMWIIFGCNVGTVVTGWMVILVGFNFKIESFALPLIGFGMVLRLFGQNRGYANIGLAIAGFGLLFMGIAALKNSFAGADSLFDLHYSSGLLAADIVLFALAGFVLTTLLQSSTIMLILVITSLAGGVIALLPAAAIIIGSNVGSTTTALFAAIGSQPIAKRIVAVHVVFNLLSAAFCMVMLLPLLWAIDGVQQLLFDQVQAATTLVLFHTAFNVLGVVLIWRLADPLEKWLSGKFTSTKDTISDPKYLDKTTLEVPHLAITSIRLELQRLNQHVLQNARHSIHHNQSIAWLQQQHESTKQHVLKLGEFSAQLYQQHISEQIADQLTDLLRISQYYETISALTISIAKSRPLSRQPIEAELQQRLTSFDVDCLLLLDTARLDTVDNSMKSMLDTLEKNYLSLKSLLLRRGAEGRLSIARMEKELQTTSQQRRLCQQAVKANIFFNKSAVNQPKTAGLIANE